MINPERITIAVASGKGGTGKTMVSTNLFFALQQQGQSVVLVDCDAEEPDDMVFFHGDLIEQTPVVQKVPEIQKDACTFCGKCQEYCHYHALFLLPISKLIQVLEDLCHGCGACMIACDALAITEKEVGLGMVSHYSIDKQSQVIEARMNMGVFSPVAVIKAALKSLPDHSVTILDAPPGTSCPFIHTVAAADYVILVTEPTPFGLSDLRQSIETLRTMDKRCGVIVNRIGYGDSAVYDYLRDEKIPILMEIPFDRDVAYYYSNGEIVARYRPEWSLEMILMLDKIIDCHGDSDHQR